MNIKLLKETAAMILKRPRQLRMEEYFTNVDSKLGPASHCGTAACIAGWGITLSRTKSKKPKDGLDYANDSIVDVHALGKRVFELTEPQADRLFFVDDWPVKFYDAYKLSLTAKDAAKAAHDRIHYFIRTGK